MTTRSLSSFGLVALVTALLGCGAAADAETSDLEEATSGGTGASGANPGDAASSCRIDPKLALQPFTARDVSLGAFRVSLGAGSALSVRHALAPSRALFSSSSTGLLSAARHELAVEEHQGSFDVREKDVAVCTGAKFTRVGESAGGVRLEGMFTGGGSTCAALRFTADLCEARAGHLAFDVSLSDRAFGAIDLLSASEPDERIYGLGEQFARDSLDLKGRRIRVLAQEGGVGRGHQPISSGVDLASHGLAGSEESTYYAAPHILTSKLRSFFLENDELSVFDFTAPDRTRARVYSTRMRGRVLYGASPLELVERFTEYAGRMPPLPAWVGQGAIVALARPLDESLAAVTRMRAAGVEVSAVWNQTWSGKSKTFVGEQVLWNWAYNPAYHPGWQAWVDALDRQGIKTLCYVNSMFRELPPDAGRVTRDTYAEGLALGAFVQAPGGGAYKLPVTAFDVSLLDLTKPSARTWMKGIVKSEMIDKARCSGWMADFAEALPFDAKVASGVPGATHHNQYPVEWARLNREVVEENGLLGKVLVWNRSGFTRTPGASLLVWEGDQLTTWDKYDGLVSALHGLVNGGLSGIALNHSDTGGYTSLSAGGVGYVREAEQLQRWTEMNAFTSVLRTHEGNQPEANAQVYDAGPTLAHFARLSKVYKALAFYRQELFAEAASRGYPVVRHLLLSYPTDPESWRVDDEFTLGSEILVAPVHTKCFTPPLCPYDKEVYLPPGAWVHLWSGREHGSATKGTRVSVKAPLGEPAVFYRKGSSVGATFAQNLRAAGVLR